MFFLDLPPEKNTRGSSRGRWLRAKSLEADVLFDTQL